MKVLHFVVGAVVLNRVPDVDPSTSNISIVSVNVVDADTRNVVDTQQVNSPPVGPQLVIGARTVCHIPISSFYRRVEGIRWEV